MKPWTDYQNTKPYPDRVGRGADAYVTRFEALAEWQAEEHRVLAMFKQDLFEDLAIETNPRREKLFSHAWDAGHAYGFSEVYNTACRLVELIE